MNRVREGTHGYVYPSSTRAKEVRLGTPPFRGVPSRTLPGMVPLLACFPTQRQHCPQS